MTRSIIIITILLLATLIHSRSVQANDEQKITAELSLQYQLSKNRAEILFWNAKQREVGFRNASTIFPSRIVRASTTPYPLIEAYRDLLDVTYTVSDKSYTLEQFINRDENRGLIVLDGNSILLEHYAEGNSKESLWISFSVSKSISSLLIGAAIKDGYINSVEDPVASYLPQLKESGYSKATIKDILQMSSGVSWNEDYSDPQSDVALAGGANGIALLEYLAKLPSEQPPGKEFNYNTGETNLVGAILRAAIGNNASTYLEDKIWQSFGMEHDAYWLLGSKFGGELGGCCLNATLRDYARLGIYAKHQGRLRDGSSMLPDNWMIDSTTPSNGYDGYGYLWWLNGNGTYAARGIFGQMIYVDPNNDLVIASHGSASSASGSEYHKHLYAVTDAIRLAIK